MQREIDHFMPRYNHDRNDAPHFGTPR